MTTTTEIKLPNPWRASDWYTETSKTWGVKTHGAKPTAEQLQMAHYFGKPGKQSLALAMALRDTGVTGSQMMFACDGHMQRNHIAGESGVIAAGWFKRVEPFQAGNGHTVFKLEITPRGLKRVETLQARDKAIEAAGELKAEVAKAKAPKRASKPRKAGKRAPKGASEAFVQAADAAVANNAVEINAQINADIAASATAPSQAWVDATPVEPQADQPQT